MTGTQEPEAVLMNLEPGRLNGHVTEFAIRSFPNLAANLDLRALSQIWLWRGDLLHVREYHLAMI